MTRQPCDILIDINAQAVAIERITDFPCGYAANGSPPDTRWHYGIVKKLAIVAVGKGGNTQKWCLFRYVHRLHQLLVRQH